MAMSAYGTLAVKDLLASKYPNILDYGEDRAYDQIQRGLDAYNALTRDQLATLCDFTTERIQGWGGLTNMDMDETNEWGRADAQKAAPGGNIGFPLRMFSRSLQWTRKWFQNHSPVELAKQYQAIQAADTRRLSLQIRNALFRSTNYTFKDKLIDNYALSVVALTNGDGMAIPYGPNAEVFNGSTHTHFLATASLVAADIDALINTVAEHYGMGRPVLFINQAQEATMRGLTGAGQFSPILPVNVLRSETTQVAAGALDTSNAYNRQIGVWGNRDAAVWVKPWVPAGYMAAVQLGLPVKPLAIRERRAGSADLQLVADDEEYPLRANTMEREAGVAVQERTGAAALYLGGGSYVDPTLAA